MNKAFLLFLAGMLAGLSWLTCFEVPTAGQAVAPGRPRQTGAQPVPTATPTPTPGEDTDVLRVETELVNLSVRVVDRNNRPINGLRQSEFKVYEENVEQRIEFFSTAEVPTNYSLVIDNSGSLRRQIDQVIEASKILVSSNRPDDETSIIRFVSTDKIEILQDFTSNKTDLNDALDNLYIEGGQTAIIDAVYLAAQRVTSYEKSADGSDRKRRALILVSDGADVSSYYTEPQLFELLRESDVQIYVVGFINELSKEKGFIRKSEQSKAKSFLERLASETGGRSFFPGSVTELNGIAKEIASELRIQYSIGYLPPTDRKPGEFRNIKVVVTDGPNQQKRIAITRAGILVGQPNTGAPTIKPPPKVQ